MANISAIRSTRRNPSKSDASAVSPSDGPESRLFACSKMAVHQKEVDKKRLNLRQKYGKTVNRLEFKPRTFVTKVQIKPKKPTFKDDKEKFQVKHEIQTPRSTPLKQESHSIPKNESRGDKFPAKNTCNYFPKNRLISSAGDSIDLLWADESSPEQEEQEYLEINKLIRYLSRRQRESSALVYKIPQRPTASFARPTKGEISLWMKSPANKNNVNRPFSTGSRDGNYNRPSSRAWSLPLYHFHSPSAESVRLEHSQCIEIRRPFSVPPKKIPPK